MLDKHREPRPDLAPKMDIFHDLELPSLALGDGWGVDKEIKTKMEINGMPMDAEIEITRLKLEDMDSPHGQLPIKIVFRVTSSEGERILGYQTVLKIQNRKPPFSDGEEGTRQYWSIIYRRVAKEYRHKGFGNFGMDAIEELINRVERETGMYGEWTEVMTGLASVISMAEKRGWQVAQGDEERVERIKARKREDIESKEKDAHIEDITMYKRRVV